MIWDVYRVGRLRPTRVTAESERDAVGKVPDGHRAVMVYANEPPTYPRFSIVKPRQRWEHRRKVFYRKARKRLGPPLGAVTAGTITAAVLLGLSVGVVLVGAAAGLYGYSRIVRGRAKLRRWRFR